MPSHFPSYFSNVTSLELFRCKKFINDEVIKEIVTIPSLTQLYTTRASISDDGIFHLANGVAKLTELAIERSDCGVGDEGASLLANGKSLTNLSNLELGYNNLTLVGVSAIIKGTSMNSLRVLNLRGNLDLKVSPMMEAFKERDGDLPTLRLIVSGRFNMCLDDYEDYEYKSVKHSK